MLSLWLVPLAVVGLADSWYIWYKKSRQEKLACFIGHDCNVVVNSKYSTLFGVPNEVAGVAYYVVVLVVVLTSSLMASPPGVELLSIFTAVAGMALVASTVLTIIQVAVLKELCEYCLLTALVNLGIFLVML